MSIVMAPRVRLFISTRAISVATAAILTILAAVALIRDARAQSATTLPPVVVEKATPRANTKASLKRAAVPVAATQPSPPTSDSSSPAANVDQPALGNRSGSLTVPTTAEAIADIQRTPGGVEVVPDTQFKNSPANTVKDVLGWVPGVIVQPKSNIDNRVSIRGSGLTRNYGNRGVNMFMDGIPINSSDGLFDLFEIDPSAYRYVEVYKGANALRYGGNALGGAVNFVTPSGRDASAFETRFDVGSFGFVRSQVSTGAAYGAWDYFVSLSAQREDGYRDHANGNIERLNANLGYRISADAETRFYINANTWDQRLPGEVTKAAALNNPRAADPEFVRQDQQRNIDSIRVANKTTLRFGDTLVDLGVFTHQRHVDHPIYRYLDYTVADYGGFARVTNEGVIGGFRNRLIVGANALGGTMDYQEYDNIGNATKGALLRSELEKSQTYTAYAENSFYILPNVALIAGGQLLHAVRNREDLFLSDGDQTLSRTWNIFNPRAGILWDVDRNWQAYANVSRSAEVPTYDSLMFTTFSGPLPMVDAQKATTYEIGTRGRRPDFTWDLSLYRSEIRNELQCLRTSPYSLCAVVNADRTVHQGLEAGLGVVLVKSTFANADRLWLNLTYTYNDFFFDNDARWGNNRLPGVAPHNIRTEVLYKNPNGFFIGPNVEWMPQRFFADNANSLSVDPYALLNFRVGFDKGAGWSAYLEGRNLLDKRYISTTITADKADANSALFNPGTGLAVYAGLRYRM